MVHSSRRKLFKAVVVQGPGRAIEDDIGRAVTFNTTLFNLQFFEDLWYEETHGFDWRPQILPQPEPHWAGGSSGIAIGKTAEGNCSTSAGKVYQSQDSGSTNYRGPTKARHNEVQGCLLVYAARPASMTQSLTSCRSKTSRLNPSRAKWSDDALSDGNSKIFNVFLC